MVVINEDHNDIVVVGNGGMEDFVDVIVVVVGIVGVLKNTVKNNWQLMITFLHIHTILRWNVNSRL